MFEIKLFFRKHWGEAEKSSPEDKYFPIEDIVSVRELFTLSPSSFYNYGRVVIRTDYQVLIDSECELDYFISCMQDDKQAIFSGQTHTIDNSYFKLRFHYHDKLTIEAGSKKVVVKKQDFIAAFREAAESYYLLLADFKVNATYYRTQAQQVRNEWQ
jgi:hypothetical protein